MNLKSIFWQVDSIVGTGKRYYRRSFFTVTAMICWGAWANTQKLVPQSRRFEISKSLDSPIVDAHPMINVYGGSPFAI